MRCYVVWCGVVWFGAARCCAVQCGVVSCGGVWCGVDGFVKEGEGVGRREDKERMERTRKMNSTFRMWRIKIRMKRKWHGYELSCMYLVARAHAHAHARVRTHVPAHVRVCARARANTCAHMRARIYVCARARARMHACGVGIYVISNSASAGACSF